MIQRRNNPRSSTFTQSQEGLTRRSKFKIKQELWDCFRESVVEPLLSTKRFSLEFTITGRNDDYEPNWREDFFSVIGYNRAMFDGTNVDFRVAFVEWNPPKRRPLLSPTLVDRFDFLRAIVVEEKIHRQLCRHPELTMMLNVALNAAIRTSMSDFILVSGGDNFLGRDTVRFLVERGLKKRCLYRAERVEIKHNLNFNSPKAEEIENPLNIVRINVCDIPPYDQPPYTNACGDFLLLDTASFKHLRGYDERVVDARLHLDSRCALSMLAMGFDCKLIGHIFHIDHQRSAIRLGEKYPGKAYDYKANIPYHNPDHWGLADRKWKKINERLYFVS